MRRTKLASVAALAAAALTLTACGSSSEPAATPTPSATTSSAAPTSEEPMPAAKDIVDTAVGAGQFTTLATALTAAGLVDTLKGAGPFTVFAPTDDAFAKLPAGTLDTLLADPKGALTKILTYHVVPGKVMAADVVKMDGAKVKTVNGAELTIKVSGSDVMLMDATGASVKVVKTDVTASNGVIHVIDGERRGQLGAIGLDRHGLGDRRAGDDVVEQHGLDGVDAKARHRAEDGLLGGQPLVGEVGDEDLEGAVVGDEGGQRLRPVGQDADRAGRLGLEHGQDGLGDDVVVVPVPVELVAVGGQHCGEAFRAGRGSCRRRGTGEGERERGGGRCGGGGESAWGHRESSPHGAAGATLCPLLPVAGAVWMQSSAGIF